ncbi:MAG TPA: hypothetical protein VGH51_08695 [Candidatus Angelobacter sp.]|jgi:hypothetical protein
MTKDEILAAIRRAATELGRAPSRGELRRITGVSHYRVLAEFPTLREAVRAAGLEPNPKGEKISTDDLLADWKRVAEKLGRRPSRAEYVREGKYSAGALTVRFGSWSGICETPLTTKDTKEHGGKTKISRESFFRNTGRKTRTPEKSNHKGHPYDSSFASSESLRAGYGTQRESGREMKSARSDTERNSGPSLAVKTPLVQDDGLKRGEIAPRSFVNAESVLHNFQRVPLAAVPPPVVGMRRVTEEVAQMVVNTLLGSNQPSALSIQSIQNQNRELNHKGHPYDSSFPSSESLRAGYGTRRGRVELFPQRGLYKDRAVMGEPFDRSPMTNAPVNELGVMVLFGMVAAGLGLQVESVQGKFPDCVARRQVAPGKWQYLRIEFEYESKNFKLHGHDPKGCDMIVCWRHNWNECPAEIEVVELCRLFGM